MKICTDYKNWVEEEVIEPVQTKKERTIEKCKKKKCKKWCLCCNKWFCWLETAFYWVVEWVVRIIGKWVIYTICRIVSALLTLGWTILVGLKWLLCEISEAKRSQQGQPLNSADLKTSASIPLDMRPFKRLQLEVIIIDKDQSTRNPITESEIDDRIAKADTVLQAAARIEVKRMGKIRRDRSASLYEIDSASVGAKIGEWLKATVLLIGRDSVRHLTVYAIGKIKGAEGLHQPLYGSVFIEAGGPDTTLAHELGHALLSVANAGHVKERGNLMFVPWDERERDAGWPGASPTLTRGQWCAMRRSRWLDWTWYCERC